jgi:predicted DNA-binding transcriptional regulator YafY
MATAKNSSQNRGQPGSGAQSNNSARHSPSAAALPYPDQGGYNTPVADARRAQRPPRPAPHGEPMRYEKSETILRIALDMQGSAGGLSLEDIRKNYSDEVLSRRTAERLRDAVERLFPQLDQVNPGEVPKRWRLPGGSTAALATITADELADIATAVSLLRRENMHAQADSTERVVSKIRALLKRPAILRIDPDLEALTEAEGLAKRPGPRSKINAEVVGGLRQAILGANKVRLHYHYRGSGKRGFETVHPYGFLYGMRHYLIAWSESDRARDFRSFALPNIERVELLDKTFTRKRGFSLQAYAERSFGVFQEKPFDVEWRFSAKAAADAKTFLFHPTQTLEDQSDGSLIVRFRAGGALEMCWHLFTWGNEVEVLAPRHLQDLMRKLTTRARLRSRSRTDTTKSISKRSKVQRQYP